MSNPNRWLTNEHLGEIDSDQLKHLVSLYHSTLESTADGILLVDLEGRIAGYNRTFLSLWRIPLEVAGSGDDAALLEFVTDQLADPDAFLARVWEIYGNPNSVTFDSVTFKDGREFDRFSQPQLIDGKPVGRVWSFRDVSEQRATERRLRESERWLRQVIDLVPHFIFAKDAVGRFVLANVAVARNYGTTVDQLLGKRDIDFARSATEANQFEEADRQVIETGKPIPVFEEPVTNNAGEVRLFETTKVPITLPGMAGPGVLGVSIDATERRLLEAELQQSQKMEAIGRLAGGVAHDFNNLLTAILGFGASLLDGLPAADPRREDLEGIVGAARRAAELTRQLLAFGRRQVLTPQVLDLNDIVGDLQRLLDRVLGEDVALVVNCWPSPLMIKADRSQLEQVLINLAVNAREAMPGGGSLLIETSAGKPGEGPLRGGAGLAAARVRVKDAGVGISTDKMKRIFEPFFTTKPTGTGLGLSMAYGIVKQSGGEIMVESKLGAGTSFDVYLPITSEPVLVEPLATDGDPVPASGTIMVVEDEEAVRRLTRRLLTAEGYHVLEAGNGSEALALMEKHPGAIDVLLTDLVMPGMNGRELARVVRERRPGIRIIYMSGYAADLVGKGADPDPSAPFLQKPFDASHLKQTVRSVLPTQQ